LRVCCAVIVPEIGRIILSNSNTTVGGQAIQPTAPGPVGCCATPALIRVHRHAAIVEIGGVTRLSAITTVCSGCWAVEGDSNPATLAVADRAWAWEIATRIARARRDHASAAPNADGLNFVPARSFVLLGRVPNVDERFLFGNWKAVYGAGGEPAILARYRQDLSIPVGGEVTIATPLPIRVFAGNRFLDHVFAQDGQRFGADDGHIENMPFTFPTLTNPDEIYLGRDGRQHPSYKFLRQYAVQLASGRTDYVYHMVIVETNGAVRTAYRLRGGENAFNGKRRGRLVHAFYL
jgi:hypothetical protein